MTARLRLLILGLMILLLLLSACSPDVGVLPSAPDGDDSGEDVEMSGPQETESAEEGTASVHYHYLVNLPDLEFKIEPVIPLDITQAAPGSFEVTGIGQTQVQLRMVTSGSPCNVNCDVILKFEAVGEIQLDENTGNCIIPMSFSFLPQADEWILDTDCPDPAQEILDCATLSLQMADPSVYTFTKNKRDVTLPSESTVTLRAEIKDVIMPRGTEGICNW
ncbi:MAG: hypothetical protein WBB69_06830 [Anaerolineales bacterium]